MSPFFKSASKSRITLFLSFGTEPRSDFARCAAKSAAVLAGFDLLFVDLMTCGRLLEFAPVNRTFVAPDF